LQSTLEYWAARLVIASLRVLPRSAAFQLGIFYAFLLDHAMPRLRKTAYRNLSFALPEADPRVITNGVFRSIGRLIAAFAHFPGIDSQNISDWIRYEGFEHFGEAQRRGRGVLFATAHLGNWELSAFAHAVMAAPMHVVVRPLDNARVDHLVESRRALSGNKIIRKKEAARAILRALSANEAIGILIDQNSTPEEGVFVDFFGVQACAGTAFVKLAAHSGAAIIPGFALWSEAERRYILRFYPIVELTGDVTADTARLHKQLESAIREYPDQWLWIHRRWKTRPRSEPALYP
jgi:KDO2-lipid IV(A) lauroyltransferase